ncbi:MAG: flotillin family protein, partial [Sphingomonadaceae bacterium]|nr:flotillin family protein [Sphingomonadaceae bacterium]
TKMALLKVLPEVIRESAKPMEAIESIKIVQVDGLTNGGKGGASGTASVGGAGGGTGNLANDAVSAALAYRAQAPVLDGLMKELGLDGSSLNGLVKGPAAAEASEAEEAEPAPAKVRAAPKPAAKAAPTSDE